MKKLLIILFFYAFLLSCQSKQPVAYEEKDVIHIDSLKVEQIKIPTH